MLNCLVPVLFIFYIQGVLKLKKNNSGAKGLIYFHAVLHSQIIGVGLVLYNPIHQVLELFFGNKAAGERSTQSSYRLRMNGVIPLYMP